MAELIPKNILVKNESVAIIGWEEGGAGFIDSWLEKETNYHISCFINVSNKLISIDASEERYRRDVSQFAYPTRDSFKGKPLVTSERWIEILKDLGITKVLCISGSNTLDGVCINHARNNGFELINAIHPTSLILEDAKISDNVVIFPRAIVGYRSEISSGVLLNTGCQIDHHNSIGFCSRVNPGVVTAGNVTVGEYSTLHTGAVVKNKIRIGRNTIIGAGAVVIKDVPDNVVCVGVPGRIIEEK